MADPGWYPDPSGAPRRLRYWTGTSWSGRTTSDPESPLPKRRTATKTRKGLPIFWLAGLVVLILIAVLSLMIGRGSQEEPDIWNTSLTDSPIGQVSNLF